MKDNLHFYENGIRPKFIFENGRRKKIKMIQPEIFQIKTMVVAPLRVT